MAKIVLVEDEKLLNDAYKLILESDGHKLITAFNGEEGIEAIEEHKPDVLLLDLIMPKMSGVEVLEKLNVKKDYPTMKVVVFTNVDDEKDIDKIYGLGADKYVLKVWSSPKQLIKIVRDVLEGKSL